MKQSQLDEQLSSFSRNLWIWLPISGGIILLLSSLLKTEESAERTGFEALTQSFANSVNLIHASWVQQNKPKTIEWEFQLTPKIISPEPFLGQYKTVTLNKNGWPIFFDTKLTLSDRCQQIWLTILPSPLSINGQKIFSSPLITNGHWIGCKYRYSELSFSYWIETGRIEKG